MTQSENPKHFPVCWGWNVGPGGLPLLPLCWRPDPPCGAGGLPPPPWCRRPAPRGAATGSVDHLPGPTLPPRGNTGTVLNLCMYGKPGLPQPQPCCSHDLYVALSQGLGRASSCPPACGAPGPGQPSLTRSSAGWARVHAASRPQRDSHHSKTQTTVRLTLGIRVVGAPGTGGTGGTGVPSSPFFGLS